MGRPVRPHRGRRDGLPSEIVRGDSWLDTCWQAYRIADSVADVDYYALEFYGTAHGRGLLGIRWAALSAKVEGDDIAMVEPTNLEGVQNGPCAGSSSGAAPNLQPGGRSSHARTGGTPTDRKLESRPRCFGQICGALSASGVTETSRLSSGDRELERAADMGAGRGFRVLICPRRRIRVGAEVDRPPWLTPAGDPPAC